MDGLRVLITNLTLASRTGTELYVQELATALLVRGHSPIVYSTELGEVAKELREKTIPVIDNLDHLTTPPDIIHGQHNVETMTALLHFPNVPAVYFFHDNLAWHDVPPVFPRILRYVAVDYACRDRLVSEYGIPDTKVRLLYNSVDLKRFRPRGPLPASPKRALAFGTADGPHLAVIREACARTGLRLDCAGTIANGICEQPEEILKDYDVVFARGRSALEAAAVGSAVILCGHRGIGPMVTSGEFNKLRGFNFGHRALQFPFDADVLAREIARYDPADVAVVRERLRVGADQNDMIDDVIAIYEEALDEYIGGGELQNRLEARAAAGFLRWLTLRHKQDEDYKQDEDAKVKLKIMLNSKTFRLRNQLLRVPGLGSLARAATRLMSGRR